jgi:hypothetical protein
MDIFKILASVLLILGILLLLISCLIFLKDGGRVLGIEVENKWYAFAPFILGGIFMYAGVSIVRNLQNQRPR